MNNYSKNYIDRACIAEAVRLGDIINRAQAMKNNNAKQNAKKALVGVENLKKLVDLCADSCTFDSEAYTKDRDFEFVNIGTVAEQIIFHIRTGRINLRKARAGKQYDHLFRGVKAEYKACLSPTSCNTPYTGKADVLLINGQGIYFIPKEEAVNLVNSQGRFKYNESYIDYVPDEYVEDCYKIMDLLGM